MTEKKHHGQQEEPHPAAGQQAEQVPEAAPATTESPASGQEGRAEIEALREQLAQSEAKSAENLDGWQRSVAEFQNFKKRLERDRESDQIMMKGELIRKFLPVLDDLERAVRERPAPDSWSDGIELILRKLQAIFQAEGLKRIDAEGQAFDPNFHEALSTEPVDGMEGGRVVAVVRNGYMLGDRVIRPAQVRVSR